MFWKLTALSSSSPVDSILDRENFTLDELLDEEEIIQECKALNSRLINFLRDREQIEQLLRYIVIEPPEDADSKRTFKFPFIACEIFTCEIDVILKALVEEEELMNLLFSFLDPNRTHSALLAGYFSKVVICLMLRKAVPLMNYVQAHQDVFAKLVDLIGITSIMEVLVRLVDADDHVYPNSMDVMQWLVDSNLLEMIADKLNHSSPPEVHANAAETLCAVTRTAPSPLATKLSSPSFVSRIFGHALENADSKSALVHSLTVCISLLDPRRSNATLQLYSYRSQHSYESPVQVDPETVGSMLPKLGDLLMLLNVSADEKILPTTYGELRPPLGKHRLKIVEFIAVLLKSGNDIAEKEMISSGTLRRVFDLMFEYPYNNALHHHVESIVYSCLESKNDSIIDHLFVDCHLVDKILQAHKHPSLSGDSDQPTKPASGKKFPKVGYLGHLTRISNKLVQLANKDKRVQGHIQENSEWNDWQSTVLQEHNLVENVYRWACGRPTALQDRSRDSDDETGADRDFDVSALADNLNQVFRYTIYDNDGAEEGQGAVARDDQDAYFNDESAEVVISSLRLGDDQGSSLFTNSNWFAFQDNATGGSMDTLPPSDVMDDINLKGTSNGGNSSSDDEVVVGEDEELAESKFESNSFFSTNGNFVGEAGETNLTSDSGNPFSTPLPGWGSWDEASDFSVGGSSTNPFLDPSNSDFNLTNYVEVAKVLPGDNSSEESVSNGTPTMESNDGSVGSGSSQKSDGMPSLFEDDVKFVGVEPEGTEKAMEQALKEGIVGEAGPLKRNVVPKKTEKENLDESGPETNEFNDTNYWRVEQEVAVLE